jgi:hypothetical protein
MLKTLCDPPSPVFILRFVCFGDWTFTMTLSRQFLILGTICLLYGTATAQAPDSMLANAPKCAVSTSDPGFM